jgi:hypothetical protein
MDSIFWTEYLYIHTYIHIYIHIYFRLPYVIWPPSTDSPELPSFSACQHFSSQKELNDFGQNLILLVYYIVKICAYISQARQYAILVSARALTILILALCTKRCNFLPFRRLFPIHLPREAMYLQGNIEKRSPKYPCRQKQ